MKRIALLTILLILALAPYKGALGEDPARALWALHYVGGPFWRDFFHPTEVSFPEGGWWWVEGGLETIFWAPIAHFSAIWAWSLLWVARMVGAVVGTAMMLEKRGLRVEWSLVAGLWPTGWLLMQEGAIEGGAILWLPLVIALVERQKSRWWMGLWVGCTPGLSAASAISLAIVEPQCWKKLKGEMGAMGTMLALRLALLLPENTLLPESRAHLLGLSSPSEWGSASIDGIFWSWGSPLLLLLVGRGRWRLLGAIGIVLALGPHLLWDGSPLLLAGKAAPLPLLFVAALPPVSVATHLYGFGWMAGLATAMVGAERRGTWWGVALAMLLLQSIFLHPGFTELPKQTQEGAVFRWPLPKDKRALLETAMGGGPTVQGLEAVATKPVLDLVQQPIWQLSALQELLKKQGFAWVEVEKDATWGQGPEVGWLLGTLVPVDGPAWPPVDLQKHAYKSQSTVPVLPTLEKASSDWTSNEKGLSGLFDPALGEKALTSVWLYTSSDGITWENPRWIAHSLTSLGLSITPEGVLLLTGMVSLPHSLGPAFPPFHSSSVVTLTSPDGNTWGSRRWWLADRLSLVDSQIDFSEGGHPRLVAWARTGPLGVDPVKLTGAHPLVVATMRDEAFVAAPPELFVAGMADPMIVEDKLYATKFIVGQLPEILIWQRQENGWKEAAKLPGLTVPFVSRWGDHYRLFAHGPGIHGGLGIVSAESTDGIHWSTPHPLPQFPDASQCESPVATSYKDQYLLFCSRRDPRQKQPEVAPPE